MPLTIVTVLSDTDVNGALVSVIPGEHNTHGLLKRVGRGTLKKIRRRKGALSASIVVSCSPLLTVYPADLTLCSNAIATVPIPLSCLHYNGNITRIVYATGGVVLGAAITIS